MQKLQSQGVHHITLVGAGRQTSIDFWEGVLGTDLDDARAMAEEALAFHIEGLVEDGEAIPEPSSLEGVMADADNRDGVAILVAVKTEAKKAVRVNITLAEDVLSQIDAFAEAHGYTRSGFIAKAAQRIIELEGGRKARSA
ncbi:type II toxin-antitoxin system HicB family antitoxin [Mesorhizobium sp.]|uniref:type II toxin-antitoxin system HicB family antitoxin n=1 Tax=Mesorhizobium sp. TaxID=1871066 RepID=UPI000FE4EB85|nr:type II toxin-antitoxin system HicB family antitoxin [Mesorhizobium sp.]RWA99468.1 MAG: CopG family transcriptional regulator [Mesorhizobium sp.]